MSQILQEARSATDYMPRPSHPLPSWAGTLSRTLRHAVEDFRARRTGEEAIEEFTENAHEKKTKQPRDIEAKRGGCWNSVKVGSGEWFRKLLSLQIGCDGLALVRPVYGPPAFPHLVHVALTRSRGRTRALADRRLVADSGVGGCRG